jgi:hypothetical protein
MIGVPTFNSSRNPFKVKSNSFLRVNLNLYKTLIRRGASIKDPIAETIRYTSAFSSKGIEKFI